MAKTSIFLSTASRELSAIYSSYGAKLPFGWWRIPTLVWMTPILPFINDTRENIEGLLDYCLQADVKGILLFDVGVTLREGDREFFYQALDRDFPGIRQKYVHTYGNAYDIPSPHAKELMALIRNTCSANSILCSPKECFAYLNEFPERYVQQTLF